MPFSEKRTVDARKADIDIDADIGIDIDIDLDTVVSKKLEHGCRMIMLVFPSRFGLGLEDIHVPTFWSLL